MIKIILLLIGFSLIGCTTNPLSSASTLAQKLEIQGFASVLQEYKNIKKEKDLVTGKDPEIGSLTLRLIVNSSINPTAVAKLGKKNERLQAIEKNISTAKLFGIKAERVGLTEYVRFEASRQKFEEFAETGVFDYVVIDRLEPPNMASASIQIQVPELHIDGLEGLGKTVVIIDTGVDDRHPDFGGRVVEHACYSSNTSVATSLCPNGQTVDTSDGSGANCDDNDVGSCDHGTHVAAIAAGRRALANASGVATQANIIAIQVFSRFDNDTVCGGLGRAPCVLAYNSDTLAALSHVRQILLQEHPIAAVNMSLGGGSYTTCPGDIRAGEVTALRNRGVATVIASGNSSFPDSVGAPGCIPDAITVGNVHDNGVIRGSSNSGEAVDLLAPGTFITAATPNNGHETKTGTSMAAPVVAGLITALQAHYSVSVSEMETLLEGTGVQTPTLNQNRSRPWIRAHDAWQTLDNMRPAEEFVWMRDQWADTGLEPNNTGLPLSNSPYIWFRHQADCSTAEHQPQAPEFGSPNFGCIKVHNSGRASASGTLQLYFSNANFDHGASWKQISSENRTLPPNTTAIFELPWATVPAPGHYCAIARWVPDGEDLNLSFPGGFVNSVKISNELIWRNFNSVNRNSGNFQSALKFESNHDGVINMVIDISELKPGELGELGELIIKLGGDPGNLSAEPTSSNYQQEGRYIIIPLKPGVSYIPEIKLPSSEESVFEVQFRFRDNNEFRTDGRLMSITISDVEDVGNHKKIGSGELSSMTYEIIQ